MPCVFSGEYHDDVWGTPVRDSRALFGQLSLVTQQCGVSWRVVWNKRHHYEEAFHGWDIARVAAMTDADLDALCDREGQWAGKLMQHRGKLAAIMHNARLCVTIHEKHARGLAGYLWSFVDGDAATVNSLVDTDCEEYRAVFGVTSRYSDALSAALRGRGFKFIGSVTIQAFLLQNGLLNGHSADCPKNPHALQDSCSVQPRSRPRAEPAAEPPPTATTVSKRRRTSVAPRDRAQSAPAGSVSAHCQWSNFGSL